MKIWFASYHWYSSGSGEPVTLQQKAAVWPFLLAFDSGFFCTYRFSEEGTECDFKKIIILNWKLAPDFRYFVYRGTLLVLSSFTWSTVVGSELSGMTICWGVWPCNLISSVVLPSGQIPATRKCPLWSDSVSSLEPVPESRMAVPGAGRPPALRTDPSSVWSSHMQVLQSVFALPITHCRLQSKSTREEEVTNLNVVYL